MTNRVAAGAVATTITALVQVACTLASPTYITSKSEAQTGDGGVAPASKSEGKSSPGAAGAASCGTDDFVKPDLTKLTACKEGKGHCFDKAKAPMDGFTACPNANEVCVPDEILEANGKPLKSCKSIIGDGACVTASLIPEIEKQGGSALKKDVCDDDQLCVPCVDPTNNNAPTPFCQPIGVHEKACSGGAAGGANGAPPAQKAPLEKCCTTNGTSNGVCLAETAVPEDQREDTIADTCKTGNKCVPAAFVEGKPVKCKGGMLTGAGVCMDKCFNGMLGFAGNIGILDKEGCGETEVCVPCSFLEGKGAPGCEK